MATNILGEVFLREVRLSFPKLWKKEAATAEGKPKYGASFLMDPDTPQGKRNIRNCRAAIKELMMDKWKKEIAMKAGREGIQDGDDCISDTTGEPYAGYSGMVVVSAKNEKRFPVIDRDKTPLTEEDDRLYGGCFVNAVIRFYLMDDKEKGGKGVFASLEGVQFKKDGEAFGSAGIDPDDYFDDESFDDDDGVGADCDDDLV